MATDTVQDLLEVMCTRTNAEIAAIKDSYKAQFGFFRMPLSLTCLGLGLISRRPSSRRPRVCLSGLPGASAELRPLLGHFRRMLVSLVQVLCVRMFVSSHVSLLSFAFMM
jgi:hypothetical protein